MHALIAVITTAAALLALAPSAARAQSVGGTYEVRGTNLDGSAYKGTATIEVTSKTTCRIRWETGSTSNGICMRNDNAFSAAYVFGSGAAGLVVYEMKPDGTLDGLWTIADTDGVGTETLTPIR
ncbi:hypothetical protein [Mangrovicella endophytica]|uniref:hypothetical protein n=1 Tax=Mangrovicella endophytica TaxID=2066697 RepID=UPI000C9E9718|nr:hypothetical protein [Mangrovicella endophytica]